METSQRTQNLEKKPDSEQLDKSLELGKKKDRRKKDLHLNNLPPVFVNKIRVKTDERGEPQKLTEGGMGKIYDTALPVEDDGLMKGYKREVEYDLDGCLVKDEKGHPVLDVTKKKPDEIAGEVRHSMKAYREQEKKFQENPTKRNFTILRNFQIDVAANFVILAEHSEKNIDEFKNYLGSLDDENLGLSKFYEEVEIIRGDISEGDEKKIQILKSGEELGEELNEAKAESKNLENQGAQAEEILKLENKILKLRIAGTLLDLEEKQDFYETSEPERINTIIKSTGELVREERIGPNGEILLVRSDKEKIALRELSILTLLKDIDTIPNVTDSYLLTSKNEDGEVDAATLVTAQEKMPGQEIQQILKTKGNEVKNKVFDIITLAIQQKIDSRKLKIQLEQLGRLDKAEVDSFVEKAAQGKLPNKEEVKKLIGKGRLEIEDIFKIIRSASHTLAQAHEKGVIHEDIKPGNLLFDEKTGKTSIIDWGISVRIDKKAEAIKQMKRSRLVVGKRLIEKFVSQDLKSKDINGKEYPDAIIKELALNKFLEQWPKQKQNSEFEDYLDDIYKNEELAEFSDYTESLILIRRGKGTENEKRLDEVQQVIDNFINQEDPWAPEDIMYFFEMEYEDSDLPDQQKRAELNEIREKITQAFKDNADAIKGINSVYQGMITLPGFTKGTPLFSSPEQMAGHYLDHRLDLAALGKVGFILLAGYEDAVGQEKISLPLREQQILAAKGNVINEKVKNKKYAETLNNPEMAKELIAYLNLMIAMDPKDRPQSGDDIDQQLGRIEAKWKAKAA